MIEDVTCIFDIKGMNIKVTYNDSSGDFTLRDGSLLEENQIVCDEYDDEEGKGREAIQRKINEMFEREKRNRKMDNRYYDFNEAVKASEKIIGEKGQLIDTTGEIWDCFNLMDNRDSREEEGSSYWCVGYDGSIGYTENDGCNVRWDFQTVKEQNREVTIMNKEEFER